MGEKLSGARELITVSYGYSRRPIRTGRSAYSLRFLGGGREIVEENYIHGPELLVAAEARQTAASGGNGGGCRARACLGGCGRRERRARGGEEVVAVPEAFT